ncbi:glycosyltransferase [Sedimenticola hydrogenitrophicus]|uniref:glycosyltransferase n=1 Tax=Sedimenticola hydrogenitrophicus TaxID=2967975 RepID=UPI0023B12FA6|nr:glycosyltransferase [Sedimenticola hydrogenitrophicus]
MKNRRKVLVIAGEFPPLKTIGRIRSAKFVQHMRQFGWQPYVLTQDYSTSDPNYFCELEDEIPDDVKVFRVKNDVYDELLIQKVKRLVHRNHIKASESTGHTPHENTRQRRHNDALKDILLDHFKSFFKNWVHIPDDYIIWSRRAFTEALKIIDEYNIDLVYTSLPPISACITGYKLKLATNLPWIVDYRDLWTGDVLREWINPLRNSYEVYLEKKLIKKADVVISVSEQKTQYLRELHSSSRCQWVTLTNGYDSDVFEPFLKERKPTQELDEISFVYTGRLFKNRRGYSFAEALGQIYRQQPECVKKIRVHIYGGISPEIQERYNQILNRYEIHHLYQFHGDVSYHDAMRAQVNADYLLLIVDTGTTSDGVIPGKLFEYIASKRPIFALCDSGATKDIIEKSNAGVVVPVESVELCKKVLLEVLQQDTPTTLPVNQPYLSQFERLTISKKLASLFDQTVKNKAR